jgi:ssDNA-binding Zn-finger/Zn-ribbon topoisomerase 1
MRLRAYINMENENKIEKHYCEKCGKELILKRVRKESKFDVNTGVPEYDEFRTYSCPSEHWWIADSHHSYYSCWTLNGKLVKGYMSFSCGCYE